MNKLGGALAGLTAASIWGGMYVVSKVVLDVIPPFALVSLRLLMAIAVLGFVAWRQGGLHLNREQWRTTIGVGLVGYGISLGLQFVGTKLSTAANGALVTSASPAFIFLFAALLLREQLTLPRLAALLLATVGVLVVIDPRAASLARDALWGNLALFGAALTWGLYSVLVKRAVRDLSTLQFSFVSMIGGLPICLPAALVELRSTQIGPITPGVVGGLLFLGIISTALAMYLWNKSFELLDAGVAALFFFAQPVVGAGLGWWLLREHLSAGFFWGGTLIALSLALAAWPSKRIAHPLVMETVEGQG